MTVLSGRARFGARSVLRAAFYGATAVLVGLFASGCGNDTFTNGTPVITISATPGPFTAYLVEVDQILLTRSDNTPVYPLLQPQIVDFTKLTEMPEVFGAPSILEGSYISAAITVNYGATLYQTAAQILVRPVKVASLPSAVSSRSGWMTTIVVAATKATTATQVAATASAPASHCTARGAGLLVVRKTPQMPMNPKTAIWMVCQPRAEAESLSSRPPSAASDRGTLASSGSIDPAYCKG